MNFTLVKFITLKISKIWRPRDLRLLHAGDIIGPYFFENGALYRSMINEYLFLNLNGFGTWGNFIFNMVKIIRIVPLTFQLYNSILKVFDTNNIFKLSVKKVFDLLFSKMKVHDIDYICTKIGRKGYDLVIREC